MFFREQLSGRHHLGDFSCGNRALDVWLATSALHADGAGTSRTYVWLDEGGCVVAYFALAPHVVRRDGLPLTLGRGSPTSIPSILLGKLALAAHLHGQGHGSVLLVDALEVALRGIMHVGGRLVVVDAINDQAHRFYQHYGFSPFPAKPDGRLGLKASDAARSIGLEWP